jgi:scyllo-inositol 2-dehydrogenase (NADP+)
LTIRNLIEEGRLGEVVHYEAHFDRYRLEVDGRWKEQEGAGGGIFYDLGSHLIDQALNIFGHPDEILLDLGTQRIDAKQPDYFHLLMNYGKRRVILHGATIVYETMPRYIIHGTAGSFIKTGIDPQEESLKQGRTPSSKGWGDELQENHGQLFCRSSRGDRNVSHVPTHLGQYQSFYDGIYKALRNGAASPMPLADSLDVMRAIEFGLESWRQRSWVKWKA